MFVARLRSVLPRSFRGQLALSFALLGALLAIVLSAALGSALAQRSRHEAGTVLHGVASNAARLLGDGLELRLREVKVLAAAPTLWDEGLDSERVKRSLYRSQAINPFAAWLGVADAEGVVRSASGGMLVDANVAARAWFAAGLKAPFVGDARVAAWRDGKDYLTASVELPAQDAVSDMGWVIVARQPAAVAHAAAREGAAWGAGPRPAGRGCRRGAGLVAGG